MPTLDDLSHRQTVFDVPQMGPHCLRLPRQDPRMQSMRWPPPFRPSPTTRSGLPRTFLLTRWHLLCQLRPTALRLKHGVPLLQKPIEPWQAHKAPEDAGRAAPPPNLTNRRTHLKGLTRPDRREERTHYICSRLLPGLKQQKSKDMVQKHWPPIERPSTPPKPQMAAITAPTTPPK